MRFFHFFGLVEVVADMVDMVVEVEGVGGEVDTSENHRRRVKVAVATVDVARASWELVPMSEWNMVALLYLSSDLIHNIEALIDYESLRVFTGNSSDLESLTGVLFNGLVEKFFPTKKTSLYEKHLLVKKQTAERHYNRHRTWRTPEGKA